jgi:cytidylate kinase
MNNLYSRLVDKMVWLSNQKPDAVDTSADLPIKPYITISRDPGSGGKPIARLLSEKLGLSFYDDKLISEIAHSAHARKEMMAQVDERTRTMTEDFIHSILNPEYISERRYVKHLCKVALMLSQQEAVVFLGRGLNYVLPGAYGLHVRVTAPYRVCVSRAVQYEGVDYQEARKIIREVTKERAGFVKQYFGKEIKNSKYYDITVNTTFMTLDDAVRIIEIAYKRKLKYISTS